MRTFDIAVGPIPASSEHVSRLLDTGASTVGVTFAGSTSDARRQWRRLTDVVEPSAVGVVCAFDDSAIGFANLLLPRPAWIEVDIRGQPSSRVRGALSRSGVPLRASCFSLDYDEDPAWVFERVAEQPGGERDRYVVSLLDGIDEPFAWLRFESGKYDEDVTLADIVALASEPSIVATMEWTSSRERSWFLEQLPPNAQLALYVASETTRGAAYPPTVSMAQAYDCIDLIRGRSE